MKAIRVLVIEDSTVIREFLQHLIAQDGRLEVAAAVSSAEEALGVIDRIRPDVISLDIWLPGMDGFAATRSIMSHRPTPIVILSAGVENQDLDVTMKALEAGALTVLEKPAGVTHTDYELLAERLCTQLAIMSQVKVVKQRVRSERSTRPDQNRAAGRGPKRNASNRPAMLGIATSTGGPPALAQLLSRLGPEFSLPIVLVQHMTATFLEGFVAWLESVCPFQVVLLKGGEVPAPGRIYVAPADRHLCALPTQVTVEPGDPVCNERPSATVLFRSMAKSFGSQALAVLLTGMGEDGAAGLLEIRKAGGYTIAEDPTTAIVYGMPGAAVRAGAVCESLPLPEIAPRILDLVSARTEAVQ